MRGERRQEAQPENSPGADVQKFFASMAHEPAKEAPPQAAAGAEPASQAQPALAPQGNCAAAQPFAAAESAATAAAQAPRPRAPIPSRRRRCWRNRPRYAIGSLALLAHIVDAGVRCCDLYLNRCRC
jgi:hypothetical protein